LWLDRVGRAEYVFLHGVCFPIACCLGRESHNLWLGTVHAVQPTFTPENRHRFHFHRQPYCLGIITRMSKDRLGTSTPGERRPEAVPRSFSVITFFGMIAAAMFFVVLLGGRGATSGALLFGVPLFPVGFLVGLGKIIPWHKSTPLTSQDAIQLFMASPYVLYILLLVFFCLIRKWRWYWVGVGILFCLLLINVAGCHEMLKQPIHGPE